MALSFILSFSQTPHTYKEVIKFKQGTTRVYRNSIPTFYYSSNNKDYILNFEQKLSASILEYTVPFIETFTKQLELPTLTAFDIWTNYIATFTTTTTDNIQSLQV